MADLYLAEESEPGDPSSGNAIVWPDNTAAVLCHKDDTGRTWARSHNASIAAQGAGFSTDTYVTGSNILIPSFGVQAQAVFRWRISASKTAAGTATPIYTLRIGTNATTADTSRLVLTGTAQTAAVDTALIELMVTVRSVGASGVLQGSVWLNHTLAATGFSSSSADVIQGTSSSFDNSALGGSYIGLSINGGTSAAWTLTQTVVEASW